MNNDKGVLTLICKVLPYQAFLRYDPQNGVFMIDGNGNRFYISYCPICGFSVNDHDIDSEEN